MLADWCSHRSAACPPGIAEEDFEELEGAQLGQEHDWDRMEETATGQSVFGHAAQLSGMNLYVRLKANRAMAGEPLMANAPLRTVAVPTWKTSRLS